MSLVEYCGFREKDIVILTDDQSSPSLIPTKSNILRAMEVLVQDAKPGDSLFFHFAGHGQSVKDLDGDEADGLDEAICPLDFDDKGCIIDDVCHNCDTPNMLTHTCTGHAPYHGEAASLRVPSYYRF